MLDRISIWIIKFWIALLGRLPWRAMYALSDGIAFLLGSVVRYRRKVIGENLRLSFPEKGEEELKQIQKDFYRNFSDILLESLKGFDRRAFRQIPARYTFKNVELIEAEYAKGRSCLIFTGHFNNWEWLGHTMFGATSREGGVIYKPMTNKAVDALVLERRSQSGSMLISMPQTGRMMIERRKNPSAYTFIADQSPSDLKNAHWVNFLNRRTAFLHGVDKLSRKLDWPVFYAPVIRVKRGVYELPLEVITLDPKSEPEGAITKAFAEALEQTIRAEPANWLWSHRRWKHAFQEGFKKKD